MPDQPPAAAPAPELPREDRRRLLSLDALRGAVIGSMLLVNHTWNPAVFHRQLFHVDWNDPAQGATLTDLVFPWFLFVAGASVPLSMRSGRGRDLPAWRKLLTALRRGFVLYALGVLLTLAPQAYARPLVWADLFTWNILQIIGAAYVVTVAVFLLPRTAQIGVVAAILLAKWAAMTLIPWEAVSPLVVADSRLAAGSPVGPGTFAHYHGVKEYLGLHLGWIGAAQQFLPAAAIAVLGGWTTLLLADDRRTAGRRLAHALLLAAGLAALGLLLQARYDPAGGGLLGRFTVPLSKWFFSVPYCLWSAGTAAALYGAFWLVIDARRLTDATALRVWGLNAIFLYVASGLLFVCVVSRWQVRGPDGAPVSLAGGVIAWADHATGTAWAGAYLWPALWLGAWWLVCRAMYRRKVFVRV